MQNKTGAMFYCLYCVQLKNCAKTKERDENFLNNQVNFK